MNKRRGDLLFLFIIIVLAIGIGMFGASLSVSEGERLESVTLVKDSTKSTESFVPAIHGFYRPYARHIHDYTSKKWHHSKLFVHRCLKKCGLK